jgi:hypothetical protein
MHETLREVVLTRSAVETRAAFSRGSTSATVYAMRQSAHYALALLLTVAGCRISGPTTRDSGAEEDGAIVESDADGDGISDAHEGAGEGVDSDFDGIPDYQDDDSDNDGLPDSIEAGDADLRTPPRDSDGDFVPDFRDTDADGNGIPDGSELDGDIDGDGIPNFSDTDDDGDFIRDVDEIRGNPGAPPDFDRDGMPDFQDIDSDNDTISDGHERDADTDNDGMPDANDLDSDRDGVTDAAEAGDGDVTTPPRDSDEDGIPNFRDPDSDNDGLSDGAEVFEHGTNPNVADSDGDGVPDLIEVGAETDPTDATDSPRTRGDFYFIVPYMEPPDPLRDTLTFRTSIQFADIYFSFDTTGSMSAELAAMRSATDGVPEIIRQLRCAPTGGTCMGDAECAAGICFNGNCIADPTAGAGCIPDMWTGVATWDDFNTFRNRVSLQPDPTVTAAAIPGTGGGGAEAPFQPPYCVADRTRCTFSGTNCASSGIGCGGFRNEAIRIYIQITDADQQCSGTGCSNFTASGGGGLLRTNGIRFIGLYGTGDQDGTGTAQSVATDIANAARPTTTSPIFVYPAIDSAVVSQTVAAVRDIARGIPLRVTIDATDEPGDAGDALPFIAQLVTNTAPDTCSDEDVEDSNSDGVTETYPTVTPGNPVCWDVVPAQNDTVMPAATPLVFKARLTVYGDGSPLDDRFVYFLVPPVIPDPGGPM